MALAVAVVVVAVVAVVAVALLAVAVAVAVALAAAAVGLDVAVGLAVALAVAATPLTSQKTRVTPTRPSEEKIWAARRKLRPAPAPRESRHGRVVGLATLFFRPVGITPQWLG